MGLLASCAHDQTVRIWACPSGQLLHTLAIQTGSQYTVAFSGDGRWLASGAGDATIYIWDTENGELLLALKGHTASVRSVMFVPNRHMLLSVGFDGLIFVWELAAIDALLLNRDQNGDGMGGMSEQSSPNLDAARRIGGCKSVLYRAGAECGSKRCRCRYNAQKSIYGISQRLRQVWWATATSYAIWPFGPMTTR
ncbi:MAG: hypothetical protein R2911_42235 [Caldilineaceae bacterium]